MTSNTLHQNINSPYPLYLLIRMSRSSDVEQSQGDEFSFYNDVLQLHYT